jgi:hypothetical protein
MSARLVENLRESHSPTPDKPRRGRPNIPEGCDAPAQPSVRRGGLRALDRSSKAIRAGGFTTTRPRESPPAQVVDGISHKRAGRGKSGSYRDWRPAPLERAGIRKADRIDTSLLPTPTLTAPNVTLLTTDKISVKRI